MENLRWVPTRRQLTLHKVVCFYGEFSKIHLPWENMELAITYPTNGAWGGSNPARPTSKSAQGKLHVRVQDGEPAMGPHAPSINFTQSCLFILRVFENSLTLGKHGISDYLPYKRCVGWFESCTAHQ